MNQTRSRFQGVISTLRAPSVTASPGSRLLLGVSWQVIMTVFGRILTFSISIIQARLLGKSCYGELGMALSTLTLFGLFSSASAGATCTKFIAELRVVNKPRAERICGLSFVVMAVFAIISGAVCFVGAPYVASGILKTPQLSNLLRLSAAALISQSVAGVFSGVLYGLQAFKVESIARTFQAAIWLPLTAILTIEFGLMGAMSAYVLSYTVGAVVLGAVMVRECSRQSFRPSWQGIFGESRVLLDYSIPMMLHGLLCVPTLWITNAILARQPHGYSSLGGYTAAFQFRTAILQLPLIVQTVAAPVLSEIAGKGDAEGFLRLFDRLYRGNAAVGLTIGSILAVFGQYLLGIFGKEFVADNVVFGLVMACAAISLLSSFTGVAMQMLGATWPALYANIAYAGASIILALVLVPTQGAIGLSAAFIISTTIQCVILIHLLRRIMPHVNAKLYSFLTIATVTLVSINTIVPPTAKLLVCMVGLLICSYCCRPIAASLRMKFTAVCPSEGN